MVIDSLFYGKLVFPALNAILYNVLSGPGKGPNIFGTEPWHFYFKNLLLNFGFWLLPATVALPAILLRQRSSEKPWGSIEKWRHLTLTVPFYVWLTIFSLQPHKEERFLFPVYPFLMMNAAISLHYFMIYFGSQNSHAIFNKLPARLRLLLIFAYYIAAIATGIARTCGVIDAYIAPASIYLELQKQAIPGNSQTFCLGKEWYRFPSSFFVPSTIQSGFIQSDFTGLLPGKYEESKGHGLLLSGTRAYPKGMNDMNLQDPGKFVCNFKLASVSYSY